MTLNFTQVASFGTILSMIIQVELTIFVSPEIEKQAFRPIEQGLETDSGATAEPNVNTRVTSREIRKLQQLLRITSKQQGVSRWQRGHAQVVYMRSAETNRPSERSVIDWSVQCHTERTSRLGRSHAVQTRVLCPAVCLAAPPALRWSVGRIDDEMTIIRNRGQQLHCAAYWSHVYISLLVCMSIALYPVTVLIASIKTLPYGWYTFIRILLDRMNGTDYWWTTHYCHNNKHF